jgi:hypothetical protein
VNLEGMELKDLAPSTRTVHLQLSPEGETPLMCGTIDATRFRAKRRALRFRDRHGDVPEAGGLRIVRIRVKRSDRAKLKAVGRELPIFLPAPGDFRVTVAVRERAVANEPVTCLSVVTPLKEARRGLTLP